MDAESVVRTYADMIYKIAYRYMRAGADAEDVFSEVWLIYFKKERRFESEEHRKAWLIRVTINAAKSILMKRQPTEELTEREIAASVTESAVEERLDLRAALERLKPEYREVICLYYIEDLPVKTIAAVLGRNENTVKTQLMRGREALRKYMGE